MILVISNAQDVTSDHFTARLCALRVPHVRLNTEDLLDQYIEFLVDGAASSQFDIGATRLSLDMVRAVYYRRPIPPRVRDETAAATARWIESEVRSTWGGVLGILPHAKWVNHPLAISGALYKPEQLARATKHGFAVPASLITNNPDAAMSFCDRHDWEVITKPIGHGEIIGATPDTDFLIYTNKIQRTHIANFSHIVDCPTLFQQWLSKEVDVRVTVVGDAIHAVALHSQDHAFSAIDCRRENMRAMRYTPVALPPLLAEMLISFVRSYDLVFGAIDLVRDVEGQYWFLELNPAGQWAWLEQLGYADISRSLIHVLTAPERSTANG